MQSGDGGIDVLAEDRTYTLAAGSLRPLLFLGNRVRLSEGGAWSDRAAAWPGPDRQWICFALDGARYLTTRPRLVPVVRGEVPVDRLTRLEVPACRPAP